MGRKSRLKREWRKKYPGGWKQYYQEQKPESWSFTDDLAAFDIPDGAPLAAGIALFFFAFVIAAIMDVLRLIVRR